MIMNTFKRALTVGAVAALFATPSLFASAQTYDGTTVNGDTSNNTTAATTTDGTGAVTPGVPSTGVGPSQATANAVLLGISAVTALVGGYFLTTGRKRVV
jgi:hypothetical protein